MARKRKRSRRRKGGQGKNNVTSKIVARAPEMLQRMQGTYGTSKILARAKSIRRRMGEAQARNSPSPAPQQQDNPKYEARGQNEVDRDWVNVATQEDEELGHITDPNIGKRRKWYDPRRYVGMGGKRRRRRRTRRNRRKSRRNRRKSRRNRRRTRRKRRRRH